MTQMVSHLGHLGLSRWEDSWVGQPGSLSSSVAGDVFVWDVFVWMMSLKWVQWQPKASCQALILLSKE